MKTEPSTRPVKKAGYTHAKLDARKAQRRQEAETRALECSCRTIRERLDLCSQRRGFSHRETARLTVRLAGLTPRENVVPSGMN